MKRATVCVLAAAFLLAAVFPVGAQEDERLFERARLMMFDKKWQAALEPLQRLADAFPASRFRADARFYAGKCLEELREPRRAIAAYEEYLKAAPEGSLREEAEVAIIDQAYLLFQGGEAAALQRVTARLGHALRAVRYYAAFTLSYVKERKLAAPAVAVLRGIIERERDDDLRDRARIALLRIDPAALPRRAAPAASAGKATAPSGRLLHIRIGEKGKPDYVSLSIPLALADLALKALSDKDRRALRREGYDVDSLLRRLTAHTGLVIEAGDEETRVRIWIE